MRTLRNVFFGLAVGGLVCMTATAEPPAMLKKVAFKNAAYRNVYLDEQAKVAPPILAVRDARTGKISTQQRMLNMTRAGLRTNAFDQFSLPGSRRGGNLSYRYARAYTDPNAPGPTAWTKGMAGYDDGSAQARPGPNDPFCAGRDTVIFDEYIVDMNDWPDPNDPNVLAEVTYFQFQTRATNETPIGSNEDQINQLNVTFFSPDGNEVLGAWQIYYNFGKGNLRSMWPGRTGGWFPSSFNAYCGSVHPQPVPNPSGGTPAGEPNGWGDVTFRTSIASSGWFCLDWIDHDLDANLVPKFDPNNWLDNIYLGAGMMYAGGIGNWDPNLGFGGPRDPNYPLPGDTIQNGQTLSTLLRNPNDPNSPPLNQIWLSKPSLWRANTPTMRCGADPNSDGEPGVSYFDILQNEGPNAPLFMNWFGVEPDHSHVLTSDFAISLWVKSFCQGEDPNAGNTCRTDLDGDCQVGAQDLTLLLANWFQNNPEMDLDCDPNTPVGAQDLTLLLAEWFNDCR